MQAGSVTAEWASPYEVLRRKWGTIPCGQTRIESRDLLQLGDRELLAAWDRAYHRIATGPNFGLGGWYLDLYRAELSGRKVLDLCCGMGASSLHFAEHGARFVLADLLAGNVRVA